MEVVVRGGVDGQRQQHGDWGKVRRRRWESCGGARGRMGGCGCGAGEVDGSENQMLWEGGRLALLIRNHNES
jgi:hypothetical protein